MKENKKAVGRIVSIIGAIVDVEFSSNLPAIYNALRHDVSALTFEVEQQIDAKTVRCLALGPTDGLARGEEIIDTGAPISVPIGDETLGRMFNVVGEPIDN
jgi:F-type H+-transporting ATPase subunit beta